MSDPKERVIEVSSARPRLASQAPKVRMVIRINELARSSADIRIVKNKVMVKIIPSRAKRAIRRCFRWRDKVTIVVIVARGRIWIRDRGISRRGGPNLRLTRPTLVFSFCDNQGAGNQIISSQSLYFL